jgi:hypothetical protein
MNIQDRGIRTLDDLAHELEELEAASTAVVTELVSNRKEHSVLAHQAHWHIRGMIYHCLNLLKNYTSFGEEFSKRASTGTNDIIMHSRECQALMFDFYALVSLARISLDNLRTYLAPLFVTPYSQLPKSVRDFNKDKTDCPIYWKLAEEPLLDYLIDIRDCLVHYRSFASNDITLATDDHTSFPQALNEAPPSLQPMLRAFFRRISEDGLSINIYLPDRIFETDGGNKKMAQFTYHQRINLLSQSVIFTKFVSLVILASLIYLRDTDTPCFSFNKRSRKGNQS